MAMKAMKATKAVAPPMAMKVMKKPKHLEMEGAKFRKKIRAMEARGKDWRAAMVATRNPATKKKASAMPMKAMKLAMKAAKVATRKTATTKKTMPR